MLRANIAYHLVPIKVYSRIDTICVVSTRKVRLVKVLQARGNLYDLTVHLFANGLLVEFFINVPHGRFWLVWRPAIESTNKKRNERRNNSSTNRPTYLETSIFHEGHQACKLLVSCSDSVHDKYLIVWHSRVNARASSGSQQTSVQDRVNGGWSVLRHL